MKHQISFALCALLVLFTCCKPVQPNEPTEPTSPATPHDTVPLDTVPSDSTFQRVNLSNTLTHVQPATGLVLWPDLAREKNSTYNQSISLEFSYCLPCKVVTGKQNGQIQYDWAWFESLLNDIASRNHQAIVRFRYEYPSGEAIGGVKGATAVPQYIKDLEGYEETYSKNPGGDGPTYYADWRNAELQWFTKQFYADFDARYGADPRIAFVEIGFGHWSEYHIYGTNLNLGVNFPSKAYQKEFFLHLSQVMRKPWAVSIDAADDTYTPFLAEPDLMRLTFGLFDDSFMHEGHEIGSSDGYNERYWNSIGRHTRWETGVCGGEVSYYEYPFDQENFLNPNGMYGHTWEEMVNKYHITFMISNDAPHGKYGTPERFRQAALAAGYYLEVVQCLTDGKQTELWVTNRGVAPLYFDAFLAVGEQRCTVSLKGLLPGKTEKYVVQAVATADNVRVVSDAILPTQQIELSVQSNQ